MYLAENRGHLPEYVWHSPLFPDATWRGYWPGRLVGPSNALAHALTLPAISTPQCA